MRRAAVLVSLVVVAAAALALSTLGGGDATRPAADRLRTWESAQQQVLDLDSGSYDLRTESRSCSRDVPDTCALVATSQNADATFTLTDLDQPTSVARPPADQLLASRQARRHPLPDVRLTAPQSPSRVLAAS